MNLELFRTLSEVARRGAISAAARTLGLTQPALSRRIQQLEDEFGAPLLERGRRGAVLTDVGRLVEAEGRAVLDRVLRLRESVGAHLRLETGRVRLGGGATAVSLLLPEEIRAFRERHPEITFHLKEAGSRDIEADVAREELELGIVTLPVRSRELETTPLFKDRVVLVAARDHPLCRARRVTPAELRGAPLIGFEQGSAIRGLIDRALERAGISMRVVMELRSIQTILRMVRLGQGLAFVSRLGASGDEPAVQPVAVSRLRVERTLAVITKRGRPLSDAASAFLQQLRSPKRRRVHNGR